MHLFVWRVRVYGCWKLVVFMKFSMSRNCWLYWCLKHLRSQQFVEKTFSQKICFFKFNNLILAVVVGAAAVVWTVV